ncbi:UNVERIFIED_CONTAM: hypothetical protein FKN15_047495 [Acipenser sinensis]
MAAISSQALKLRVIVEADSIRKITLDTRPESVDDLKSILKDKLKLDVDVSLQYEDPDFDGELISLVDIDELPQKATLKLFMAEVETSSISTTDTELLSDVSSPERLSRWPPGQDLASLERQRLEIIQEVQKTEKTLPLIDRMMQTTFALQWQEVVTNSPPVRDILERWPAQRLESQVYAKFQRITNQNLPNIFYEELNCHTLRLMTLYRQRASKTGKTSDALADILRIHDLQVYVEFQRITNQKLPNIFYEELDRHTLRLMTLYRQRASKTGKTSDALADILRIHDLQCIFTALLL